MLLATQYCMLNLAAYGVVGRGRSVMSRAGGIGEDLDRRDAIGSELALDPSPE